MLRRLGALLSEALMGFLALAALGAGLAPLLFALSPAVESALVTLEWAIVAAFVLEFSVRLAEAPDRAAFLRDPWRVLDAAIIVGSVASLLPVVTDAARTMPALRILRLLRVILFGVKAGHGVSAPALPPLRGDPQGPPKVTRLSDSDASVKPADWNALLQWAASPTHDWIHASNLPPQRLREVAQAAGVPHVLVEAALNESSYPRLETEKRWSALTLSMPASGEPPRRDPVLLLVAEQDMLSLAPFPLDLQRSPAAVAAAPWGARCAVDVVRQVLARNEELAGRLEREVRDLEGLPADESPDRFFEATFRLKRALSVARSDLWRLKGVLEMLAEGRRTLPGLGVEGREFARHLAEEADYLYETVDNARESILSLIDLHINVAAHGTNRFMRLVAIMSTLGLVPAIVGGLLGMNLVDSPWPVTLGQVAFVALLVMLAILYTFLAKGWLK